jgi:hypothetical protein
MQELIFNPDGHTYTLNGDALPCVSDLCRFIHREVYQDAPAWRLEQAALRGTAVHAAAESLDTVGTASIEEDYAPYLTAYRDFLSVHQIDWSLIEKPLYHPQLHYAGTIDRYGMVDGKWTLVDLKTTYTLQKKLCTAQLNFYRLMLIARGLPVERMAILHLRKDKPARLVTMEEDEPLVLALLTLHNTLKKGKKGAK